MLWGDFESGQNFEEMIKTYQSEQVLTLEELPWVNIKAPKVHYPILK